MIGHRTRVDILVVVMTGTGLHAQVAVQDPAAEAAQQIAKRFVDAAQSKRGKVADVDEQAQPVELYVTLGSADGVLPGQSLRIQQPGEAIVVDGQSLGVCETPVGYAEVDRIQGDHLCVARATRLLADRRLAKGQIAYVQGVPSRLAVLPLVRTDKQACQLGDMLAQKIELALAAKGQFTVVERDRFKKILDELKLGTSDLFDATKTAQFGRQLQAQRLVLGTIAVGEAAFAATVRVVDLATGSQVTGTQAMFARSAELLRAHEGGEAVDAGGAPKTGSRRHLAL